METKYGKLISRDKLGNLVEVYPEIICDGEIDWNKESIHPVSNYVLAEEFERIREGFNISIKNAFSSTYGGLGWDDDTQRGYVDFSQMPADQIESIVDSMVDPNGAIVADAITGKLSVDFSRLTPEQIMELCSTNGGIVASNEPGANNGKLAIDFSQMPADQIKNVVNSMVDQTGAIIPNTSVSEDDPNYGKLTVDFSKLSAEQIMALCLAGGGITADQATGKLKIDFSKIDPVTKRSITSALKMQTPLEANLTIYVDNVNGDDTYKDYDGVLLPNKGTKTSGFIPHPITGSTTWEFTDSRGRPVTEQYGYPFKSMGAAVVYVSENFSLGSKSVYIRVISNVMNLPNGSKVAIPYYGSVSLPALNRTSGIVYLYSHDATNRATVMNMSTGGVFSASGSGANYELQKFDVKGLHFSTNGATAYYPGVAGASSQGNLSLCSCHFTVSYVGNKHSRWFSLRPFGSSSNGNVSFYLQSGNYNSIEYDRGRDSKNLSGDCIVMHMQESGKMRASSANTNETLELQLPLNANDAMHQDEWTVPATTAIDEDTYQNFISDAANGITDMDSRTIHIPVYDLSSTFNSIAEENGCEAIASETGYGILQGSESEIKSALAALKNIPSQDAFNASLDDVLTMTGAKQIATVAFKSTLPSLTQTNADDSPFVGNKAFVNAFGTMTWLKAHAERAKFYMDRVSWLPAFRRVEILPHVAGDNSCTDEMAILRGTPDDLKAFFVILALDFKCATTQTDINSYLNAAESIYNEALAEYSAMWEEEHGEAMPLQVKILLDERALIDELLERRNNVDKREYAYIDRFILSGADLSEGSEELQANRMQMRQDLDAVGVNPDAEIILRGKKEILEEFISELCSKYASIPTDYVPLEIATLMLINSAQTSSGTTMLDTQEAEGILLDTIQRTKIVKGTITALSALLTELRTANTGLGTSIWKYIHCDSLYGFQCNGTASTFIGVSTNSQFYYAAGANYNQYFKIPSRKKATGKKFAISGVSSIACNITGAFPGDTQGTVDARSYGSIPGWSEPIAFSPSVGTIMWFNLAGGSRSKIISGWILADGKAYSQTTYPDLYAVIGDAYNTANDAEAPAEGQFRVPNLLTELPSSAVPYIKAKN